MTIPLELEADNPAVVYRESLSKGSYWAVRHSLETITEILAGEDADPWTFSWEQLTYAHTARVRRELVDRYAPATVNKMLSALRGVLKNAWRLGMMDAETYRRAVAVENVKSRVEPRGRAVEPDELAALFTVCAEDPSPAGSRDAALLVVLYGAGLRRAELCALDLTDFDPEDCSLAVRGGKRRTQRTVFLNPDACRFLTAWIAARGEEPGPLFCPVRSTGEVEISRLGGETIWYLVKRRQRAAGIAGVSPHSYRRSFITRMLEAGVDVLTVATLAGHVQVTTTARYDRRQEGAQRAAARTLTLPVL
jgi:site-specific recombinase XerD